MAANTISATPTKKESALIEDLFAKINHAYFVKDKQIITAANTSGDTSEYPAGKYASLASGFAWDIAFPIIEDSFNMNTGDVDTTEVKILDGSTLVSRSSKGDSDVSCQIASIEDEILSIFMSKGKTIAGIKFAPTDTEHTYSGIGYSIDVKKAFGALILCDDTEDVCILLPNVEMYGALVAADGDNPAYINTKITLKDNKEGDAFIILKQ